MATEDRVTQQDLIGQHQKTELLPKEAFIIINTLLAKGSLLYYLRQIPEFIELWRQARETVRKFAEAIMPRVVDILDNLSPEARGAFFMGEKAYSLCDRDILREVEVAVIKIDRIFQAANEYARKKGIKPDYEPRLEAIVKPLGVPVTTART